LGVGSYFLGRRADAAGRPLGFYGKLELGIALSAAATPLLLGLARAVYLAAGGTPRMGVVGGTAVRLVLSALVIGLPTFLMGGTLPAVARALERESDRRRRWVAALYGGNTLGAVTGALLTTFWLLESAGIRRAIWGAAALNVVIGLLAWAWSERGGERVQAADPAEAPAGASRGGDGATGPFIPLGLALPAAGLVGFAFFLMELVWYRMLAPLLGGSSYTLGVILAVALLGIGAGGLLYSAGAEGRRPTLWSFAATCGLEAALVLLPFAAGDRLAVLALSLRPLGDLGFPVLAAVWCLVAVVVVLPASVVAGYQFPLLVALLGGGRQGVGRELGLTYTANTGGAILGALAGGFGLLPLLSAPGTWRAVAILLGALCAAALVAGRREGTWRRAAVPALALLATAALVVQPGPTAFWRHTPIGAGRERTEIKDPNDLRQLINSRRRAIVWEAEGVESSVALKRSDQYEFLINGKSDGSALRDAPTQVMSGLIGAALHPNPRRALVIGLGTGSSAGWLAAVPSIERVDVVEIEAAVLRVAGAMGPVNRDVLANPKARVVIGDGREFLLTTADRYDLIFSEPSNPYRAGISSLFTREFYAAAAARLERGGMFLQWLQGYDVDARVVRTAYATLGSVFASVETWQVARNDLLLVAGTQPVVPVADRLRERVAAEPFKSALSWVWGVGGVEGLYAGYVATNGLAQELRRAALDDLNTDDHPLIEFGFARNLGREGLFDLNDVRRLAAARGEDRPPPLINAIDWQTVAELGAARNSHFGIAPAVLRPGDAAFGGRIRARAAYAQGNLPVALALWRQQGAGPLCPFDLLLLGESLADAGDGQAADFASQLRPRSVAEAEAVLARLRFRQGSLADSTGHLEAAFTELRRNPWASLPLVERALALAPLIAKQDATLGRRLFAALGPPFAVALEEELRLRARLEIAGLIGFEQSCGEALAPFEPYVPWEDRFLVIRSLCYGRIHDAREAAAAADLRRFQELAPPKLNEGLSAPAGAGALPTP